MSFLRAVLLFFSFLFTILSGFVALYAHVEGEKKLGFLFFGIFGISFLTFAFFGWRRKVFERKIRDDATRISIEGGHKFEIDKSRFYIISIILFFSGGFLSFFVQPNLIFTIITLVISFFGFIIYFGVLFGFFAKEYLVFEEDGIRIGFGNYFLIIRWDNIMKISSGEWRNSMAVFINLFNPEDTARYLYVKKGRRDRTIKKIYSKIRMNLKMTQAHLLILPERFGLDTGHFIRMLESYLKYPERRKELRKQIPIK